MSRRRLDPVSPALECFPAVLQALTARPLQLPALPETLLVDLAAAVTAVTGAEALEDAALAEFKVRLPLSLNGLTVSLSPQGACCYIRSGSVPGVNDRGFAAMHSLMVCGIGEEDSACRSGCWACLRLSYSSTGWTTCTGMGCIAWSPRIRSSSSSNDVTSVCPKSMAGKVCWPCAISLLQARRNVSEWDWWGRVLLERLLPALLSAMAVSGADADMRFSCLKVTSDLLALLLDLSADGELSARISASACRLFVGNVLVLYSSALTQSAHIKTLLPGQPVGYKQISLSWWRVR